MFWKNGKAASADLEKKETTEKSTDSTAQSGAFLGALVGVWSALMIGRIWNFDQIRLQSKIDRLTLDIGSVKSDIGQLRRTPKDAPIPATFSTQPTSNRERLSNLMLWKSNPPDPLMELVPDDAVEACQYLVSHKVINKSWLKVDDEGLLYFTMNGEGYCEYRVALCDLNPEKVSGKDEDGAVWLSLLTTHKKPVIRKSVVFVGDDVAQESMVTLIDISLQSKNPLNPGKGAVLTSKDLVQFIKSIIHKAGGKPVPILQRSMNSPMPE
ncbi:MAG: hypothetical protein ACKOBW_09035 [Planctomycetota bacterium]